MHLPSFLLLGFLQLLLRSEIYFISLFIILLILPFLNLRNRDTLKLGQHDFVRDNDGSGIVIGLGRDEFGIFILNGALIAEKFHLNAPTLAKFEYLGPLNMFMVSFLADDNAQVANNAEVVQEAVNNPEVVQEVVNMEEVVQEVIDISSDEEVHMSSDEEEEGEDHAFV